ncbi:serine protease [Endothiovibrio diazotrophicus]
MKSVRILVAALFSASLLAAPAHADRRVVNGQPASTTTYPWMVSLTIGGAEGVGSFGCGGSLISSTWVLTAAHCFLNADNTAVDTALAATTTALLKSDDIATVAADAIQRSASRVVVHPQYDHATNDYDIALVELSAAVDGVIPVTLHGDGQPALSAGTAAIVMGWGLTSDGGEGSDTLLQASQQIVDSDSCSTAYGGGITGNMVCANGLNATDTSDTCQGDSGGPMVIVHQGDYVQVGISSFGASCGDPATPGVYARVSALADFIRQYVSDARFSSGVEATTSACAAPTLDGSLNLTIPCLQYGDNQYQATLSASTSPSLQWQLSAVSASSCTPSSAVCASADSQLNLTIPGVLIGGAAYRAELGYAGAEPLRWNYRSHTAE